MYAQGKGVPKDYVEANRWFRLAAEKGNADAQQSFGYHYGMGFGVPQDQILAYMWFSLAAAQGQKTAKGNRDFIAENMTQGQIKKAQKLARECLARNYKNCR